MYEKGKQRLLLLLSLSLGLILVAATYAAQDKPQDEIRDEDKAEVIRLTLEYALVKKAIPDYNFIKDPKNVPPLDQQHFGRFVAQVRWYKPDSAYARGDSGEGGGKW